MLEEDLSCIQLLRGFHGLNGNKLRRCQRIQGISLDGQRRANHSRLARVRTGRRLDIVNRDEGSTSAVNHLFDRRPLPATWLPSLNRSYSSLYPLVRVPVVDQSRLPCLDRERQFVTIPTPEIAIQPRQIFTKGLVFSCICVSYTRHRAITLHVALLTWLVPLAIAKRC